MALVEFEDLYGLAEESLKRAQMLLVLTDSGKIYNALCTLETGYDAAALCEALAQNGDTLVRRIVCMWTNRVVDLPSAEFRRALVALNPENEHAEILVCTDPKKQKFGIRTVGTSF